jgi:hypothetical protein
MIKSLAKEIMRRGVLRALGAYIAIIWLLAQGVVDVFPALGLPEWTVRAFLIISISAIPVIAVVSWKYELTRKGFLRDRGRALSGLGSAVAISGGDPTRGSDMRTQSSRSTVLATWTGPDGRPCQQEFSSQFIVGRDFKADVRLEDERVSRRHIRVYPKQGDWYVTDLSSLNGSYIDGLAFDVRKIESDTSVSLDRGGPVIRLSAKTAEPTRLTANPS